MRRWRGREGGAAAAGSAQRAADGPESGSGGDDLQAGTRDPAAGSPARADAPGRVPGGIFGQSGGRSGGAEAVSADTGQYRILVAEDNLVNQKVARRLVEKLGYAVDVVEDGQRALAAAISGSYALVLMDCQMPVLDGFRATKAIRRLEGAIGQVPIVAMTAQAMRGDREKCIQAGMSDYLPKR